MQTHIQDKGKTGRLPLPMGRRKTRKADIRDIKGNTGKTAGKKQAGVRTGRTLGTRDNRIAGRRYSFLSKVIEPRIHRDEDMPEDMSEETYAHLADTLENYMRITGIPTQARPGYRNNLANLMILYNRAADKVNNWYFKQLILRSDDYKKDIQILHAKETCLDNMLYYIPIRFTYTRTADGTFSEAFGDITRRFLATLFHRNGLHFGGTQSSVFEYHAECEAEMLADMMDNPDIDETDRERLRETFAMLTDGGRGTQIMEQLQTEADRHPLTAEELKAHTPSETEREMHDMMLRGLEFITSDETVRDYMQEPDESIYDNAYIELDMYMGLFYDDDDYLQYMAETVQEYERQGASHEPMADLILLSPDTEAADLKAENYADRFIDYLQDLNDLIYNKYC